MALTGKQTHVLQHLERVAPLPMKLNVVRPRHRFELDGWDCTQQITALMVRGKVRRLPSGALARLDVDRVG